MFKQFKVITEHAFPSHIVPEDYHAFKIDQVVILVHSLTAYKGTKYYERDDGLRQSLKDSDVEEL